MYTEADITPRKTHPDVHAEQLRQQAAKDARLARERAVQAETARLAAEAEVGRGRKRRAREGRRRAEALLQYDARWRELLGGEREGEDEVLRFADVPWPVLAVHTGAVVSPSDLTADAIAAFLFPDAGAEAAEQARKERLREALLRFHPDKFGARVLRRVAVGERDAVGEGVGAVVRAVGELMARGRGAR